MRRILFAVALCGALIGCAAVNKAFNQAAPDQVNAETNQEIIGTHTLTPTAQAVVTDASPLAGPFGIFIMPIVSLLLLGVNAFQKVQNGQLTSAITSTVQTIENAGNDPTLAPAISVLKTQLATSHQIAKVTPVINNILADLKLSPTVIPPTTAALPPTTP